VNDAAEPVPVRAGLPRGVEVVLAALALLVAAPLLLSAAMAVTVTSRGPALFRQERVGRGGRPFTLLKLRTMRVGHGGPSLTAAGDPRVTAVGRLLRRTKVDELPSLWNVITGDLALVGPRPEVPGYVDAADPLWVAVLSVRPGITDRVTLTLRNEEALLAAVEGDREAFYREVLGVYKRLRYLDHLRRRNAWSDVSVLVATLAAVILPGRVPPPTVEEIRAAVTRQRQAPLSMAAKFPGRAPATQL
jgi:lipopolysaccharide/colanic/teichoic acid biosynthesis glycosyltransferase